MKKTKIINKPLIIVVILSVLVAGIVVIYRLINIPSTDTTQTSPTPDVVPTAKPFLGVPFSMTGETVCLPHKNQEGPQTMECAYGLKDNAGTYYGLRDADPDMKNLSMIQMNQQIQITGTYKEEENEIYPTVGVIEIQSFTVAE